MKFLRNLWRKPPPEPEWPKINEDWRVGDLAVCLGGPWTLAPGGDHPVADQVYRVIAVEMAFTINTGKPAWSLSLSGLNPGAGSNGYNSIGFRKAILDHTETQYKAGRWLHLKERA